MSQLVNPKDVEAQATSKAPLDMLEPVADEAIARALYFGGVTKGYGIRNYVQSPIAARVYVAAIRRHVAAWLKGEDCAPDSGVHHLGHIGANVHVALAAIEAGTFIDDRHGREGLDSTAKPPTMPSVLQRAIRETADRVEREDMELGAVEEKPSTVIDVYSPAAKGELVEAVRGVLGAYDLEVHHDTEADLADDIVEAVLAVIS